MEGRAAWVGQSVALLNGVDLRKEVCAVAVAGHSDATNLLTGLDLGTNTHAMRVGKSVTLLNGMDLGKELHPAAMAGHSSNRLTWADLGTEGRAAWVGQYVALFNGRERRSTLQRRVAIPAEHQDLDEAGRHGGERGVVCFVTQFLI